MPKQVDLTDTELERMQLLCDAATRGPWKSFIEGRDHESGSDFGLQGRRGR
jgi:hypothetical protein